MVVTESYEVLADRLRKTIETLIPEYRTAWALYDPSGSGSLRAVWDRDPTEHELNLALQGLLRALEPPLGHKGEPFVELRAKVLLLASQPGFDYRFGEVLLGMSALVSSGFDTTYLAIERLPQRA